MSLTQTKGFTINPYSKGSKNKVDIIVHNSGVPTEHGQPTIKLTLGGKSVKIEWKLPESHFTDEQAEVQAIDPNSARYNAYTDTMDKLYRSGNQVVNGFFRGAPQVVKLNVECTGVPKTERFNVLTDRTVCYQGPRLCIPTEFRQIPAEFRQKAPTGTEFDRNSPEQAPECAIILT